MEKINYEIVEKLSEDSDVLKQLIKTVKSLSLFNGTSQMIPNKKILINTLGIQESRSSSAIENIYTTNNDVFETIALENELENPNAKEVINYSKAVIKASEFIKDRPISQRLLEDVQQLIEPQKAGVRRTPVQITNMKTGEVVHMPPPANELSSLLGDLLTCY